MRDDRVEDDLVSLMVDDDRDALAERGVVALSAEKVEELEPDILITWGSFYSWLPREVLGAGTLNRFRVFYVKAESLMPLMADDVARPPQQLLTALEYVARLRTAGMLLQIRSSPLGLMGAPRWEGRRWTTVQPDKLDRPALVSEHMEIYLSEFLGEGLIVDAWITLTQQTYVLTPVGEQMLAHGTVTSTDTDTDY